MRGARPPATRRGARFLAVGLLLLTSAPAAPQERASDFGAWFLRTYGAAATVGSADEALGIRAERVFSAVRAVADHAIGRFPRLLVIGKREGLDAQALPDGTVVVNLPLLRFCFGEPQLPADQGDARLAFVLGHEMAHLAYDDAWHAQAFAALGRYSDPKLATVTREWLLETEAERQEKELRADRSGFVFMLMAGYSSSGVLDPRADFLSDWARHAGGDGSDRATSDAAFATRAMTLRAQLTALQADLPFFRFGVRLLTLGRHADAIRLLERFQSTFPSREVGANLGLAYYQRALSHLSQCGQPNALRFQLSTLIDPQSLASALRLRGTADSTCIRAARDDLEAARQVLEEAHEQAPDHLPSRLNLAAALIALDRGYEAYGVASGSVGDSGRRVESSDPRQGNIAAVALYLAGFELPVDTTDQALAQLADLGSRLVATGSGIRKAVAFNRARILQERGRAAAARTAWEEFLDLEPAGPWADEALLALRGSGNEHAPAPAHKSGSLPGLKLERRLSPEIKRRLAAAPRQPFKLGDMRGAFIGDEELAALEVGDVLELVEVRLEPTVSENALDPLTPPDERIELASGMHTVVFPDTAYDIVAGRAVKRILFEPR